MPVMYLLLPVAARSGRVAMVLPMEGGLRQRQIETFVWNSEDLRSRLVRLNQENLVLTNRFKFADADSDFFSIPSVEWAFYKTAQTAKELAQLLTEVTRRIEQVLPVVYGAEGNDGYLHRLLLSFQRELLPSLKLAAESEKDYSFADIYAQTIPYGCLRRECLAMCATLSLILIGAMLGNSCLRLIHFCDSYLRMCWNRSRVSWVLN